MYVVWVKARSFGARQLVPSIRGQQMMEHELFGRNFGSYAAGVWHGTAATPACDS
jgi:hypothetical protein